MNKMLLVVLIASFGMSGCATQRYVREYVRSQLEPVKAQQQATDERVARTDAELKALASAQAAAQSAQGTVNQELRTGLTAQGERLAKAEADIARFSKNAEDALDRASAAGKLAAGKLLYEKVLSDETMKFKSGQHALSESAMVSLAEFASRLKRENRSVYIEIQGHTDSRGDAAANLRLGEIRAEAVRHYLNSKGGIPLHRMSVMSYGETQPLASNMTNEGRSQNRRVTLVVLQ